MNNDQMMKEILLSAKTIASVGLSSNQEKESYWIVSYLKEQGYHIIPVNPTAAEILGEKVYPDLSSVPEKVDISQHRCVWTVAAARRGSSGAAAPRKSCAS